MEISQKQNNENIPEWLSTHPLSERRAEFFDHFIPEVNIVWITAIQQFSIWKNNTA